MTVAMRPRGTLAAVLQLALLFLTTGACAQTEPTERKSNNEALQLPTQLMGVWVPYSRVFERHGELRIAPETLSWANCLYEEYRVIRANDEKRSYVVELLHSPPCKIGVFAPLLVFEFSDRALKVSDRAIEVSICSEQSELERPPDRRSCSWGILVRKD